MGCGAVLNHLQITQPKLRKLMPEGCLLGIGLLEEFLYAIILCQATIIIMNVYVIDQKIFQCLDVCYLLYTFN